jgi:NADH:ubiquinone oxidoreductase subunit
MEMEMEMEMEMLHLLMSPQIWHRNLHSCTMAQPASNLAGPTPWKHLEHASNLQGQRSESKPNPREQKSVAVAVERDAARIAKESKDSRR